MASIDNRYPGRYRARVSVPGAPRVTKSFRSLAEAEKWAVDQEALIKSVLAAAERRHRALQLASAEPTPVFHPRLDFKLPDESSLPYKPPRLSEALSKYAKEVTPGKKGAVQERSLIRRWQKHPLAAFPLLAIKGHHLAMHRDWRISIGITGSTLQKEFALISHLYTVARTDWGFEDLANPVHAVRKAKIASGRTRRLSMDEEELLLNHCTAQGFLRLKYVIILAIETAMRRGELVGLKWSDVDLKARIAYLHDTKNEELRAVPLSKRAVATFEGMPRTSPTAVINIHQDCITSDFRAAWR